MRTALKRPIAIALGLALTLPAGWLMVGEFRWESPVTDGLALVCGATGVALLLAGLGGRRADWIEPV